VPEALRARDLRIVIDVARTIAETEDLDTFRDTVLALAPRLVEGDVYGYNEVPRERAQPLVNMNPFPTVAAWWESLVRLGEEHPLVLHYLATGDAHARAISDLLSRREYERSEFYNEVLVHADGRDQLAVAMPGQGGLTIGLAVNRRRRGFSGRDHAVYDAVRPFLVQGYSRALQREIATGLGAVVDAGDQPVLLVGPRDHVAHVTPGAAALLADATPRTGERLGNDLARWLRRQRRTAGPVALGMPGLNARLVRAVATEMDAIVLTRDSPGLSTRALRTLGLTRREADVIALVAEGMTNASAAAHLGIAQSTVAKHLQHVSEKLGTTSRTAAVAKARALLNGD
jgi:DNA-binding CsgD family transcriptional regulator